jgi:hypothetical protein
MSDEDRRSLAELYAEDDRLRAEHEQWMADREAAAHAPVRKSDESAVLYREHHDNAPAPAPEPEAEPSDDDQGFAELFRALDVFGEATTKALADDDRRIAALERENIELKAKLDAVFQILGTGSAKKLWTPS